MANVIRTDRRRAAGQRTRECLLEATRTLLAERGEDAVTLRDITAEADVNVAAVSYHFGCLQALIHATITEAIGTMMDSQVQQLQGLGASVTVEEIGTALARPVLAAVCQSRCPDHAFLRIMARAIADPPPELAEWIDETRARLDAEVLARLAKALPHVSADELAFRIQAAIGIVNFFVTGNMRFDLTNKSHAEIEHLLIAVLTGALSGGAPPNSESPSHQRWPVRSAPADTRPTGLPG